MKIVRTIMFSIALCAITLGSVIPQDNGPRWHRVKVAGGFALGAGLSGLATYLAMRFLYEYRLKKAREDLMMEQRVNSAGVQHDLDLQRKKIKRLEQTIMTLSEALGRRPADILEPVAAPVLPPVSLHTAGKVAEEANRALVDLQFKELAARGNKG